MSDQPIKEQVFSCVASICSTGDDEINENTDIRDFGADSLDTVELILDIEEVLNIDIREQNIKNMYLVSDVLQAVYEAVERKNA